MFIIFSFFGFPFLFLFFYFLRPDPPPATRYPSPATRHLSTRHPPPATRHPSPAEKSCRQLICLSTLVGWVSVDMSADILADSWPRVGRHVSQEVSKSHNIWEVAIVKRFKQESMLPIH